MLTYIVKGFKLLSIFSITPNHCGQCYFKRLQITQVPNVYMLFTVSTELKSFFLRIEEFTYFENLRLLVEGLTVTL